MATQPFQQRFPVKSLADVERLEQTPYDEAVPVQSTYEIFRNSAQAFGDKTALTFLRTANPDDEPIRWSYSELLGGINQTANMLHALGVCANDVVAVLLPGCLESHLALWGGEAAGVVFPLNPLLSDEKLISLMRVAQAKVLIAYGADGDIPLWSQAMRVRSQVPSLLHVLRVAHHDEPAAARPALPHGVHHFNELRAQQPADRLLNERKIVAGDLAAYFHTGGTTGSPKLALHSHGAQVFTAWASVQLQSVTKDDATLNGFPLFHVAGVLPSSLSAFSAGAEVIIPTPTLLRNREVLANYWRLVEKYRTTALSAVPTVLAALSNVPLGGADISSIKYCRTGASPLSPELAARFEQHTGLHVHESFGMTETAGISTITPPGVNGPAGCVGFRMPYSQVRVATLDATDGSAGSDVPAGQQGMVLIKSPNLFSGYLHEEDNVDVITTDGWLITGDIGWIDEAGRLNISGRAKDLIIRGGHNIDPKSIEDALAGHPAVDLTAAVGAPDAYAGEVPYAFVTLRSGMAVTEAELLAYAEQHVDEAPAKPKRVTVLDKMPMTNVGKIFKPDLRLMAAQNVIDKVVNEVCEELEIPPALRPQLVADSARKLIRVSLDHTQLGERRKELTRSLDLALSRVPFKSELC